MTVITDLLDEVKSAISRFVGTGLLSLWIGGQPVAASRPRVGRWGTYYGKNYSRWIKDSWQYVAKWDDLPTNKPMIVMVEAVFEKPKTSKLDYPNPDVDNLEKGPLDQVNKLFKET